MDIVFGLYLGGSTCSLAVNKNGNVSVAANAGGERVTPAVVTVNEEETITGLSAKQGLLRNAPRSVLGVLRDISTTEDIENKDRTTCPPTYDENGDVSYTLETESGSSRTVTASTVLKNIFLQMKDISSRYTSAAGSNPQQQCTACLCLPAWVSDKAVSVTREAAKQAGFNILAVIMQPTAACLAYDLLGQTQSNLVVTLHLGESGGVGAVVEVSGGVAVVKNTAITTSAPGKTITNKLVEHLSREFYKKYRGDALENRRSRQKLFNQAENVKHILSTRPTAQVSCESLWEGIDFSCPVSRARFDGLISSTLSDFLQPTLDMMERLNISPKQIDKVILSGGTCKIPRFQQILSDVFPSASVMISTSPDEVLACGAAIEARALTENYAELKMTNGTAPQQTPVAQQNGKEESSSNTNSKKNNKKKTAPAKVVAEKVEKKKKAAPIRSHLPVLVSAVSVPIWCKIGSADSVLALARLSPPLLRNTFILPLPATKNASPIVITLYESTSACDDDSETVPEAAVLAEIKVPVGKTSKELTMTCQLKLDGSLALGVTDTATKKSRQLVVGADEDGDSN